MDGRMDGRMNGWMDGWMDVCICICIIYVCMYIYIYMLAPPQLTRTTSECVSPVLESTVGEVLSVQHQPSIFVVAHIRKNRVLPKAPHCFSL